MLMLDAWGLGIGVAAVLSAVLAIVLPEAAVQSPTDAALGEVLQDLFTLGYGISGSFIVYGLLTRNYAADALGLCLLASALTVRCIVIVSLAGWAALYTIPTLAALALAALARAAVVAQLVKPDTRVEP